MSQEQIIGILIILFLFYLWKSTFFRKKPTLKLILDLSLKGNLYLSSAWTIYGGTRWMWQTGEFFQHYPELRNHKTDFEEEYQARFRMVEFWEKIKKKEGPEKVQDPYLDLLLKVYQEGFLREYVWRFLKRETWPEPEELRLKDFDKWLKKENLLDHKAKTLTAFG